jgi:hypothetical protein
MLNLDFEHPSDDALERYLLHQSQAEEEDVVETHVLACESCVSRLEALEVEIATMKLALQKLESEQTAKQTAAEAQPRWKSWFTVPTLSWAAAAATLAIGIAFIPQFVPRDVTLSAYRGTETSVVPEGKRLHMHLNAADLAQGPVTVEIVDANGAALWKGSADVRHDQVDVTVPKINTPGVHYARLYAPAQGNAEGDLLREFAFDVK